MSGEPVVRITGLHKIYGGLRPLRVQGLLVRAGERVALGGLDATAAEMLVSLITGATLPDQGEVRVLGRSTADIRDEAEWLASLDRIGLVSARAVLLSSATVRQNLAMPFTLSIDPLADDVAARAARLAAEVGLDPGELERALSAVAPDGVARVHLARAIAADPAVVILEHPTATLPRDRVLAFGADLARVARARDLAVLAITEDADFARALGGRRVRLQPATGAVVDARGWRRWLGW